MICAISREVPEDPAVSDKFWLLFERRLIEHHIANHGKCPVTNKELSIDDLVAVKTNKEWDVSMLCNFALENQLHTARQEFSHALYQSSLISVGLNLLLLVLILEFTKSPM